MNDFRTFLVIGASSLVRNFTHSHVSRLRQELMTSHPTGNASRIQQIRANDCRPSALDIVFCAQYTGLDPLRRFSQQNNGHFVLLSGISFDPCSIHLYIPVISLASSCAVSRTFYLQGLQMVGGMGMLRRKPPPLSTGTSSEAWIHCSSWAKRAVNL